MENRRLIPSAGGFWHKGERGRSMKQTTGGSPRAPFVLAALLVIGGVGAGCGGGPNNPDARLIPGGGVGDGAIDGAINVIVIDQDTDQPISGAQVFLGDVAPFQGGSTDANGLFHLEDETLKGPITVTATAANYVNATWFGVDGA